MKVKLMSHDLFLFQACSLDLVFIVDASGSVKDANPPDHRYDNWDLVLQAIASMVKRFVIGPDDTQVAAIVFGSNAQIVFSLNTFSDETEVLDAIQTIPYLSGNTDTGSALKLAADCEFH